MQYLWKREPFYSQLELCKDLVFNHVGVLILLLAHRLLATRYEMAETVLGTCFKCIVQHSYRTLTAKSYFSREKASYTHRLKKCYTRNIYCHATKNGDGTHVTEVVSGEEALAHLVVQLEEFPGEYLHHLLGHTRIERRG